MIIFYRCCIFENCYCFLEVSYYMMINFKNFFCLKVWIVSLIISGLVFRSISFLNEKINSFFDDYKLLRILFGYVRIYVFLFLMNG